MSNQVPTRLIHSLDTPFAGIEWPLVTNTDQDVILDILCSFLEPLGVHRCANAIPSKGKKVRRSGSLGRTAQEAEQLSSGQLPTPETHNYVDVGLSSITRNLQAMVEASDATQQAVTPYYSMIFVSRGRQSPLFSSHFPLMVGAASQNQTAEAAVRLIGFSKPCSDRLSKSLGLARVSAVAIKAHAPGAEILLGLVREVVPLIQVPWLQSPLPAPFAETRIQSKEAAIGRRKMKGT